jgi:ankyrin repeat protein
MGTHAVPINENHPINNASIVLLNSSKMGCIFVVECAFGRGANIEEEEKNDGNDGYTALMLAAAHGHTDVVQCLLAHGANSNHQIGKGWTA